MEPYFDMQLKKQERKQKDVVIILCSFAITFVLAFFIFVGYHNSKKQIDPITIHSTKLEAGYVQDLGYEVAIKGIARNNSKTDFSYVSVKFIVYDVSGRRIGTAIANVNDLLSGDTWEFKAVILGFPSTQPYWFELADIYTIER